MNRIKEPASFEMDCRAYADNCSEDRFAVSRGTDVPAHLTSSCEGAAIKNLPKLLEEKKRGHYRNRSESTSSVLKKLQNMKENYSDLASSRKLSNYQLRLSQLEKRVEHTESLMMCSPPPTVALSQSNKPLDSHALLLIERLIREKCFAMETRLSDAGHQILLLKSQLLKEHAQPVFVSAALESKVQDAIEGKMKEMQASLRKEVGSQQASLRKEVGSQLLELREKMKKLSFEHSANPESQFFRTNRKYSSNPISFLYEEYVRAKESAEESRVRINKITYFIDDQGFLLDEEGLYLVNSHNQQVKLSEKELRMLRKTNILA